MSTNLLSPGDLTRQFKVSASTLKRLTSRADFPPPIMIGALPRWREDDIAEWLSNRPAKGDVL